MLVSLHTLLTIYSFKENSNIGGLLLKKIKNVSNSDANSYDSHNYDHEEDFYRKKNYSIYIQNFSVIITLQNSFGE